MTEDTFIGIIGTVVIGLIVLVICSCRESSHFAAACHAKGGVVIHGNDHYCIKPDTLIQVE